MRSVIRRRSTRGRLVVGAVMAVAALASPSTSFGFPPPNGTKEGSPLDALPGHITRINTPPEATLPKRPEWASDGRSLFFMSGPDVWFWDAATGTSENLTADFPRIIEREIRLGNGDLLLCVRRGDERDSMDTEMFLMPLATAAGTARARVPVAVNSACWEGFAVSRRPGDTTLAFGAGTWTRAAIRASLRGRGWLRSQLVMGRIVYDADGQPRIADRRVVLDQRVLSPLGAIEAQDFRGVVNGAPEELIFAAYGYLGTSEVLGLNLHTGQIINYSRSVAYEEPEGIAPDGSWTLVERAQTYFGADTIDLWRLNLDGLARWERLTRFAEYRQYGSGNGVVASDGRRFAFAARRDGAAPGTGIAILVFDLDEYTRSTKRRQVSEWDRLPVRQVRGPRP